MNISTNINECEICSDLNCARCFNSSDCLRCNVGYYIAISNKSCIQCQTLFLGCITCT
jgi:hypothetical protein